MSSGTEIIQAALRRIGAHSKVAPASADSISIGRDALNSMLELWLSQSIFLGVVPLEVPGSELSESLDMRNPIIDNLAIQMAPDFDNGKTIVSQDLKNNARAGLSHLKNLYQTITIPSKVVSSTLPTGSGNDRGARSRAFFATGSTIEN